MGSDFVEQRDNWYPQGRDYRHISHTSQLIRSLEWHHKYSLLMEFSAVEA